MVSNNGSSVDLLSHSGPTLRWIPVDRGTRNFMIMGRVRRWRCHGHLWELILSPLFPEREDFWPTCPDCHDLAWPDEGNP
jgi:hypothetical protein